LVLLFDNVICERFITIQKFVFELE